MEDALEGGEFGGGDIGLLGEFESAFLNEREADLIVGHGAAIEQVEVIGHGEGVLVVLGKLAGGKKPRSIAAELVVGNGERPFGIYSGHGFANAQLPKPIVELLDLLKGEGFDLLDGLDGGVHGILGVDGLVMV